MSGKALFKDDLICNVLISKCALKGESKKKLVIFGKSCYLIRPNKKKAERMREGQNERPTLI